MTVPPLHLTIGKRGKSPCAADDHHGWAIDPEESSNQTAAFQTVSNIGFSGGSILTFTLSQDYYAPEHLLGKFRLSVTTDDRGTFASGLAGPIYLGFAPTEETSTTPETGSLALAVGLGSMALRTYLRRRRRE